MTRSSETIVTDSVDEKQRTLLKKTNMTRLLKPLLQV